MSRRDLWTLLGIEPTEDVSLIRRAYAAALKRSSPDEDPVGFANLRQAYELALRLARSAGMPTPVAALAPIAPASPIASASPAIPATPAGQGAPLVSTPSPETAPAAPAIPSALDDLRGAFTSLQRAAFAPQAPDPQTLRALLEACLKSPALENLSIQLEFEPALIRFFAQTLPRTQSLLEMVIEHWRWRERPRSAGGGDVVALVEHADNLRRLENLHASAPRVYSALARPPRPALLWMQMVLFRLEASVRDALDQFRNISPGLLDPRAQEWWSGYFTRPHIQPGLLRATGVLALLAGFFGGAAEADHDRFWRDAGADGLLGALVGLVITGLWLGLVDWPRYLLSATRRGAPTWLRLGWAPACFGACLASALCPNTAAATYGALAAATALVVWANLMAPGAGDLSGKVLLGGIFATVFFNVPLGVWWVLINMTQLPRPTPAMTVVFIATLLAFAIGQTQLWVEFQNGLTANARQWVRAAVAAIALGVLALMSFTPIGSRGSHLLAMCLVIIVIVQRVPALNLNDWQIKIRHYATTVPSLILVRLLLGQADLVWLVPSYGTLFMLGVVVTMGASLYNDWKASREDSPSLA